MPLATQCPHCHTIFRVVSDQLKLQAGLVRCGICQQIFNGADHLVKAGSPVNAEPVPSSSAPNSETGNAALPQTQTPATLPLTDIDEVEEVIILKSDLDEEESDKEMPAGQADLPAPSFDDRGESKEIIAQNLEKKSNANDTSELEQLSFIRQANTKKRASRLFFTGIVILLILLAGQVTYLFRNFIAATYPPAKKTLVTLCEYVHCQVQLPAQISALSYEAAELHTLSRENIFEFSLLMRNHSAMTQAWPHIELTLQNAQKQPVLRRVFTPAEYLSLDDIIRGFPADQEHAVNLYFEVDRIKASDYSVAIFYP